MAQKPKHSKDNFHGKQEVPYMPISHEKNDCIILLLVIDFAYLCLSYIVCDVKLCLKQFSH